MYETLKHIPYSGKFSYGANFRIFHMRVLYARIKTTRIKNFTHEPGPDAQHVGHSLAK